MQHSADYKLSLFDLQTSAYQALQRVLVSLGELTLIPVVVTVSLNLKVCALVCVCVFSTAPLSLLPSHSATCWCPTNISFTSLRL